MSTARAFNGEMYSTRHRRSFGGTGSNMIRLIHQRKAVSVLPLPVGREDERRVPLRDRWPTLGLRWSWTREGVAEPVGHGRLKEREDVIPSCHTSYFSGLSLTLGS